MKRNFKNGIVNESNSKRTKESQFDKVAKQFAVKYDQRRHHSNIPIKF